MRSTSRGNTNGWSNGGLLHHFKSLPHLVSRILTWPLTCTCVCVCVALMESVLECVCACVCLNVCVRVCRGGAGSTGGERGFYAAQSLQSCTPTGAKAPGLPHIRTWSCESCGL